MRKLNFVWSLLLAALMMVGCADKQSKVCNISGKLISEEPEFRFDSVMLNVGGQRLATAVAEDGTFNLECSADTPDFVYLHATYVDVEGYLVDNVRLPLVTEEGNVEVSLNITSEDFNLGGTAQNEAMSALLDGIDKVLNAETDIDGDPRLVNTMLKEYLAEQAQNPAAVYGLIWGSNLSDYSDVFMSSAEWKELYEACSEEVQQHPELAPTVERAKKLWQTAEGQPFVDFEVETDGGVVKLSDYVGRGSLVLVDFWASWCGPCRAAIPTVKAVYDEFKGKGLVVVGVPTSDEPEDTRSAMEQDGITFPQMIGVEAQAVGAKAYGVRGIPHMILFGPDGTILERGLHGEEIREAVLKNL